MKRFVVVATLAGLILPFILQTQLYPFFRFGMFAEEIETPIQLEHFHLVVTSSVKRIVLDPSLAGLTQGNLNYLLRNYVYRNESQIFLEKFSPNIRDDYQGRLEIVRTLGRDSTVIDSIPIR